MSINKKGFIRKTLDDKEKNTAAKKEQEKKDNKKKKTDAELKKAQASLDRIKKLKKGKNTKIVDRSGNRAYA
jgi:hypothetical protein